MKRGFFWLAVLAGLFFWLGQPGLVSARSLEGSSTLLVQGESKEEAEAKALLLAADDAAEKASLFLQGQSRLEKGRLQSRTVLVKANSLRLVNKSFTWTGTRLVKCQAVFEFGEKEDKFVRQEAENERLQEENDRMRLENRRLAAAAPPNTRITHNRVAEENYQAGARRLGLRDFAGAIDNFQRACQADPLYQEACEGYMTCCLELRLPYGSHAALARAAKHIPGYRDSANYYYYKGWEKLLACQLGGYPDQEDKWWFVFHQGATAEHALEYFQKALERKCNKDDIHAKMALAYLYTGRKDALSLAQCSLEYAAALPEHSWRWQLFAQGRLSLRRHDFAGARRQLEQLIARDEGFIDAYRELEYVCQVLGDFRAAEGYGRRFLQLAREVRGHGYNNGI